MRYSKYIANFTLYHPEQGLKVFIINNKIMILIANFIKSQ